MVTGAISETSRYTEVHICKHISKEPNKIIVEFSTGHGNITREILNTMSDTSILYSFEVNEDFCDHVKETIQDQRLVIINDGAENLKKHVKALFHPYHLLFSVKKREWTLFKMPTTC